MAVFFLLYFGVYGSVHAYLVWHIRQAFPKSAEWLWGSVLAAGAMFLLPIAARWVMRAGLHGLADVLATIAFTWAIWIFWFLVLAAAVDAWNGTAWLAGFLVRSFGTTAAGAPGPLWFVPPRAALAAFAAVIACASAWGLFESSWLRVETVALPTPRLPAGSG